MTSTRAATVWRTSHCGGLCVVLLVALASGATPRHRLRSSSLTKIDFWSVYEDAINKFGDIGSSSSGSGQGTPVVGDQEGSKAQEPAQKTSIGSTNSQHRSQYLDLIPNQKGQSIERGPESEKFKNKLVSLQVKHIQDILGHSQTGRTEQITIPDNQEEDSASVNAWSLEQMPLDVIKSPETDPEATQRMEMSNGSVSASSDGARDAVMIAEKKVVKRRRKPVSDAGESLARSPRPRLTVADDEITTNTDNSVSEPPALASSPVPTHVPDTSARAVGNTDQVTTGEGTTDVSTTDEGTTDEGTSDEGTTKESTTDSTSDGNYIDSSRDDFATDRAPNSDTDRAINSVTNSDTDSIIDDNISDSTTSKNITNDDKDSNTGPSSNENNSNDPEVRGQTTVSMDSTNNKSSPAYSSSSPSAQQLPGPAQLWPNSQAVGEGSGDDLEAGVIDSIIASVIKIQGNFNETFPNDTITNASDDEDHTVKLRSSLLTHPNGTSVLQDASTLHRSELSTEFQHENNSVLMLRAQPTSMRTPSNNEPTAFRTQHTTDNMTSATTAVPRVAVPQLPAAPFTPPVRSDLVAQALAVGQGDSSSSLSSSVQSEGELSQFEYVVRAIQNPSRMTAAVLDVANTVGVVGGIMSLPFLLPFLVGKRRRRRETENVFGVAGPQANLNIEEMFV